MPASGACSPVLTGLIVDRTGSFVVALAVGGIVMAVGAAIYYFMVGAAITDADLD
jgi:cyanate permease